MYEWLDEYLLRLPAVNKDYKAEWEWIRYRIDEKMFAAVCTPGERYGEYAGHTLLQLKCSPEDSELLRMSYAYIRPGFYMDKRNWIAVFLDGEATEELIKKLCDNSHRLVLAGFSKKKRAELTGE